MMKLYKILLVGCCVYMILASAYKIGYKFGKIDECVNVYTRLYEGLNLKNLDRIELIKYCGEKAKEK